MREIKTTESSVFVNRTDMLGRMDNNSLQIIVLWKLKVEVVLIAQFNVPIKLHHGALSMVKIDFHLRPSGFFRATTSTFMHGFQTCLTQLLSLSWRSDLWNIFLSRLNA